MSIEALQLRKVSLALALVVATIGVLVLAGWRFQVRVLMQVLPGLVAMAPNTAVGFVLLGFSLFLRAREASVGKLRTSHVCAAAAGLMGFLVLVEYAWGADLGIDELFFRDPSHLVGIPPGRMAMVTAFCFVLLGGGLVFSALRRVQWFAEASALLAGVLALLSLTGYAYDVRSLYWIAVYKGMAVHTALAFLLLSMGILTLRPTSAFSRLMWSDTAGGTMVRRILPIGFGVPLILGWLRLVGERAGLYGTEFGTALYAVVNAVVLIATLWWIGKALHRTDTERRRSAASLARQTEMLQSILQSISDGVVVADANGQFTVFNPAAERIVGLGATTAGPDEWSETYGVFLPDGVTVLPADESPLVRAIRGESSKDVEIFVRNPRVPAGTSISVSGSPIRDPAGELQGGVVVFRDITERKRTEEALRESEQRLDLALESAQMGAWDLDLVHDTAVRTLRHDQIFGYQTPQPKWSSEIFLNHVLPDDRELAKGRFQEAFASGELDMECRVRWPDESVHWIAAHGRVYRNENGDPIRMMGVVRDVSERKRVEQMLAERSAQLEAANQELEAFSYSVSHDLRAPLRHIGGFAELLGKSAAESLDEKGRRYLRTIVEAAGKMGHLIDDLLSFSRMGRAEMHTARVNLADLVADARREIEPEAAGREVVWKVGDLPTVRGDASMLRLVFANLLSNALKYTSKRPRAEIEIGAHPGRDGETDVFVRDNGVGFDSKYEDRLFGVFQRLHRADEFEGTGIGLANVRRIIHRHGGRTWAEGAVDAGATFYFSLPTTQEASR